MKPVPRVSVVIPHLNEPEDLRRCLLALESQRQDAPSFEVIVADNGSSPLPLVVVAAFPGTRMTVEAKPGPGPARNLGVLAAEGDIVAFIDADCLAQPGWIRRIVEFFDSHEEIGFVGGSIGIASALPGRMTSIEAYEAIFSYRARLFVERDHFAATGNMAVRRSVFMAVGPFEGIAMHEDKLWGHHAGTLGYRLAYLADARVLTAACATKAELKARTDRHVAHSVAEIPAGMAARLKWLLLGAAMLASPVIDIPKILRSEEVPGAADRLRAFACLVQVRLYRGWRMLRGMRRKVVAETVGSWNRTGLHARPEDGR